MLSFRDLALTAFILGLLPAVLVHPDWGILLWTWVGLMNPHKMTWGFAYNFPFAMIIGVVTIFAILISKEPKRLPFTLVIAVLLLFIFWMTITTAVFSLFPELAWPKWEKVMKIQVFILLTLIVMQSEARIRALVLVATLSIAYFGIKGGLYTIAHAGGGMVLGPDGGFIAGNTEIALALTVTLPLDALAPAPGGARLAEARHHRCDDPHCHIGSRVAVARRAAGSGRDGNVYVVQES